MAPTTAPALHLSPAADALDVQLRTRRLPASILTEDQRDGARELIDLGLARTFTDGPDEWLETVPVGDLWTSGLDGHYDSVRDDVPTDVDHLDPRVLS